MVLLNMVQSQLLSIPAFLSSALLLVLLGGASAFLFTYILTFAVTFFCRKFGWLDRPGPNRQRAHKNAVPRLGGVGIFLAFIIASLVFYISDGAVGAKERTIYWLLLAASTLIVIVHAYDDIKGLSPRKKFIAQTIAVLIILGPFIDGLFHGVLLFGFSNPFGKGIANDYLPTYLEPDTLTLFIHPKPGQLPPISLLAIPAVLFTWFWMVGMMNTVNLIDGLDGLATGVVGITATFVAIISWTLGQDTIALLSAIFAGSVFGFLPHNWNPAKIFMGDTGSQFLGLGLAVLSIMGGAKVALALMVLGIPILDVAIVIINRVRRGQSFAHYDMSHLHYRLKATGLSVRQICYLFYGLTLAFGVMALSMTRIYKFIGFALVGMAMAGLVIWIDYRQRKQGLPIKLDGPEPGPPMDRHTPLPGEPELSLIEQEEPGEPEPPSKTYQAKEA